MAKKDAKREAERLRRNGFSYSYIAKKLEVSKGSLSKWLSDTPYTPNKQTERSVGAARLAAGVAKSEGRRAATREAQLDARAEIGRLSKRDVLMAGLGLYASGGSKSRMETGFASSDERLMRFMVRWCIEGLGVPRRHLSIKLHLFSDSDQDKALSFWTRELTLSRTQFLPPYIDRRKGKKKPTHRLPHGTAVLRVKGFGDKRFGVFLTRKIAASMAILME